MSLHHLISARLYPKNNAQKKREIITILRYKLTALPIQMAKTSIYLLLLQS